MSHYFSSSSPHLSHKQQRTIPNHHHSNHPCFRWYFLFFLSLHNSSHSTSSSSSLYIPPFSSTSIRILKPVLCSKCSKMFNFYSFVVSLSSISRTLFSFRTNSNHGPFYYHFFASHILDSLKSDPFITKNNGRWALFFANYLFPPPSSSRNRRHSFALEMIIHSMEYLPCVCHYLLPLYGYWNMEGYPAMAAKYSSYHQQLE